MRIFPYARTFARIMAAAAFSVGLAAHASESYPKDPINFIVGYAPGGPMDTVARLLAETVRDPLNVPVLVENRAGAAGSIAADYVARTKPDGYTVLLTSLNHITNAVLSSAQKFDTESAFSPVAIVASAPHVLVVPAASPIASYEDFLAKLQNEPGKVTVSNSGAGGSPHLIAELYQMKTGTSFLHIPYKGAAPAVTDLLGNHVDASFQTLGSVRAQIDAGQLRALAVASDTRSIFLPDTPTFAELGIDGLSLDSWYGALLPANVPEPVLKRLHEAVAAAVQDPAFQEKIQAAGMQIVTDSNPDNYRQRISDEIALVRSVAEAANIQPN